jgi:glycosyltransferase involved in cell wall biosynthesis
MAKALVTVVMPVYNAEEYIGRAIESILAQTYTTIELLICDDGSTDTTRAIIETYDDDRIRFFPCKENKGNVFACNLLFSKAKGDFIAIQDADDWSTNDRIFKQIEFMQQNRGVALVGTGSLRVDATGKHTLSKVSFPTTHEEIRTTLESKCEPCFVCASVMIRREVYDAIGGYRIFFNRIGAADYDWIYRISERFSMGNIEEPVYINRRHGRSFTKSFQSDPRKSISPQIAYILYQQRKETGVDWMQSGEINRLEECIKIMLTPYEKDPSLIYRRHAESLYINREFSAATRYAAQSLFKRPFNKTNVKTFFHYLRMTIVNLIT